VEIDIKDVNDFNLQTKELGCNYWSTYTKSGIGGVQVISLCKGNWSRAPGDLSVKL